MDILGFMRTQDYCPWGQIRDRVLGTLKSLNNSYFTEDCRRG